MTKVTFLMSSGIPTVDSSTPTNKVIQVIDEDTVSDDPLFESSVLVVDGDGKDYIVDSNRITYVTVCTCPCHVVGSNIMHMMPCCNLTYEKYLNEDNSINMNLLSPLIAISMEHRSKK